MIFSYRTTAVLPRAQEGGHPRVPSRVGRDPEFYWILGYDPERPTLLENRHGCNPFPAPPQDLQLPAPKNRGSHKPRNLLDGFPTPSEVFPPFVRLKDAVATIALYSAKCGPVGISTTREG